MRKLHQRERLTLPVRTASFRDHQLSSDRPYMVQHVLFIAALLVVSLVGAKLEVQIEGSRGWARDLPTWRVRNRWTERILGGRAITGYHVYAQLFVLGMAHLPFFLGIAPFTWPAEARVAAFLVLFWIIEDFLWFVLNPAYGLRGFRRSRIPWHAGSWWLFMPRDYWIFLPVGVVLYLWSL